MIQHYLKVAFRNMWKYKSQTFISVAGLAVGFACFAIAMLWIRYEMTYDSFHKNADRIYCVNLPDISSPFGMSRVSPYPLAGYLKTTFPEIVNTTSIRTMKSYFVLDGIKHDANILQIDSSFFSLFDVKIVEGNMDFLIRDGRKTAITREKALQLFGDESPVGKEIEMGYTYTVCAVVTGLSEHSNYPFDFLRSLYTEMNWHSSTGENTLVEIMPDVDIKKFKQKFNEHKIQEENANITNMMLMPITAVHYKDPNIERDVKFEHIIIFVFAGLLLILCTLFNYLMLFISRFRIRRKELALRTVYGASVWSLFTMLSVEFIISLIASLIVGLMFIHLAGSSFRTVSEVRLELSEIYLELILYVTAIIIIALAVFLFTLVIFRRRTLNANIRSNKKMFRKTSIAVQLIISIVFAFCTTIILKQMYYMHNADLGFSFKDRGSVSVWTTDEQMKILNDKIKQIPEITESIAGHIPLVPVRAMIINTISEWDGKPEDAKSVNLYTTPVSEEYAKYYGLELIEGEFLNDNSDANDVLINESAAKAFGWDKAVGKSFNKQKVKGVVKNIYNASPTVAVHPYIYISPMEFQNIVRENMPYILFKYNEGTWKICRDKITKIIAEEFPNMGAISNTEEIYDRYWRSEKTLLTILTVISLVCVIVCVFGFVSMISLACEERRKEIAIRKINGATIKDILDIFFKEHLTLLVIGSTIAFSVGYAVMKRWLEQYVLQTEISAWVYLSILLALVMAIVICIGGKVYKTSRENPVEAIKS
jgi:hypothetical protein